MGTGLRFLCPDTNGRSARAMIECDTAGSVSTAGEITGERRAAVVAMNAAGHAAHSFDCSTLSTRFACFEFSGCRLRSASEMRYEGMPLAKERSAWVRPTVIRRNLSWSPALSVVWSSKVLLQERFANLLLAAGPGPHMAAVVGQ